MAIYEFILYRQAHFENNNGHVVLSEGHFILDTQDTSVTEPNLDALVDAAGRLTPKFDPKHHSLRTIRNANIPPGDNITINIAVSPEVLAEFVLRYKNR